MKQNMKQWAVQLMAESAPKPLPLLSFPCKQLMNVTVAQLISDSTLQANGMKLVAERVKTAASVSLMDLSVEAEAFGSCIRVREDEVPTVVGAIVSETGEADALVVPEIGAGRTGLCVEAVRNAARRITDRPVLAGIIGPYSLASRLMDVNKTVFYCYDEPNMLRTVLEKATAFLIEYCRAFQEAGANGVVMAEPLAGILSPALAREFSHPYVKKIIDAVQNEEFCVIYHNCGNNVALMAPDIYQMDALGYHFGDAIDMLAVLSQAPKNVLVMGNISPAAEFCGGTPESIAKATRELLMRCGEYPNFVLSSGCDIPPNSPWENIDAFFAAATEE